MGAAKLTVVKARGRLGVEIGLDGDAPTTVSPARARAIADALGDPKQASLVRQAATLVEAAQASAARLDRRSSGGRVIVDGPVERADELAGGERRESRHG